MWGPSNPDPKPKQENPEVRAALDKFQEDLKKALPTIVGIEIDRYLRAIGVFISKDFEPILTDDDKRKLAIFGALVSRGANPTEAAKAIFQP